MPELVSPPLSAPEQTGGRHFYQFYKGPEDLFRIVVPFLRLGLENGEACLWIVSESVGILEGIHAFQRQLPLLKYFEAGQIQIFPSERWYLHDGRFSDRHVFERAARWIEEKRRLGFSRFRAIGDAGWVEPDDWFAFQIYEKKAHEWLHHHPVTALCAYPIERCTLTQTHDVVGAHDSIFLDKL